MLKIFILVAFGTLVTCFGDTIQDEDWKNKGFYRPRRNYQTQSQNRSSRQPWSQINHDLNAARETGFRQQNHQRSNAFEASNHRNVQTQNLFQKTSYNHDLDNAFGSNPSTLRTSFNQNIQRKNSFATNYSQKQDQNPFVNTHSKNQNPFAASSNSFGNGYDLRNQNQDLIRAGNSQESHSSNSFQTSIGQNDPNQNLFRFATNQNFQRQSSSRSRLGQNAFSYQNFGSNQQQTANSGSFGSFNQNTFKGYDYLPPRDKFKTPFVGPTYLPPHTTKRPFPTYHGTGTNDAAPATAMPVPPEPEDEPTPTTVLVTNPSTTTLTTSQPPFDREPSEIFPETMTTTKRPIYLPAIAMLVPPEPEEDPTPTTTSSTTTPTTTTTTTTEPPTTTSTPSTTTPEPNRGLIEEPSPTTTTTKRPIITTPTTTTTTTTTEIVTTPTTPREGPPPKPAMAIPVVLECDPSDPSTYPSGVDPRYSGGDPCNPTTTTPEPNRSEDPTTPTTTTRIVTTSTTPTTHFKAPEYLPPLNMTKRPPPQAPARAMPVPEPECDPSDPSTYPLGANPCTVPPSCIAPSVLPQGSKKRVARAIPSGRTLRLADLTGVPRPVWYVGIYDKTYTPHYKPICGGSVLTMDVVISAAHCFWGDDSLLPAAEFAVGANKIYRPFADKMDKKAQKSDVKEIIVPPRFRGVKTSFQDDIAILKLVTPFKYALGLRPLCVDFDEDFEEEQLKEGYSGTFAGWGATDAAGSPTTRLLWLELPFVQIDRCIAGYPDDFVKYLTSDKMCAGETNTGKALCGGDSGGGLVFWHGEPHNAVPYLRGIASTAPKADLQECNVQVVGTFTQISWHRRFLRAHVPRLGDECRFRD